jgi:hypothetical protein
MCFSPEMDLAAGVLVGALAVDAARHVRSRSELPLAALPAVFAVHQFVEALVWWGLQGKIPSAWGEDAQWAYLIIAFAVVPVLVPVAVLALEPPPWPRAIRLAAFVGFTVAVALTWSIVDTAFTARIAGHHISYEGDVIGGYYTVAFYVAATIGALLASKHRALRIYGLLNIPLVALLVYLDHTGLVSLWCVGAAVCSLAVVVQLRSDTGAPTPTGADAVAV